MQQGLTKQVAGKCCNGKADVGAGGMRSNIPTPQHQSICANVTVRYMLFKPKCPLKSWQHIAIQRCHICKLVKGQWLRTLQRTRNITQREAKCKSTFWSSEEINCNLAVQCWQ